MQTVQITRDFPLTIYGCNIKWSYIQLADLGEKKINVPTKLISKDDEAPGQSA